MTSVQKGYASPFWKKWGEEFPHPSASPLLMVMRVTHACTRHTQRRAMLSLMVHIVRKPWHPKRKRHSRLTYIQEQSREQLHALTNTQAFHLLRLLKRVDETLVGHLIDRLAHLGDHRAHDLDPVSHKRLVGNAIKQLRVRDLSGEEHGQEHHRKRRHNRLRLLEQRRSTNPRRDQIIRDHLPEQVDHHLTRFRAGANDRTFLDGTSSITADMRKNILETHLVVAIGHNALLVVAQMGG